MFNHHWYGFCIVKIITALHQWKYFSVANQSTLTHCIGVKQISIRLLHFTNLFVQHLRWVMHGVLCSWMITIPYNGAAAISKWQCTRIYVSKIDQKNPLCPLLKRQMAAYSAPFMGHTTKLCAILPKYQGTNHQPPNHQPSMRFDKNTSTSAEVNLSYGIAFIGVISQI